MCGPVLELLIKLNLIFSNYKSLSSQNCIMVTTNDADLFTFGTVPKSICNRTIKLGQLYVSALQQHDQTDVAITCRCHFIL